MEANVKSYWEEEAARYAATAYHYQEQQDKVRYPFYEVRKQRVLELLDPLDKGVLLDAGCGGGEILVECLKLGWDAHGFDFAENMVTLASDRLVREGLDKTRVQIASLADRLPYETGTFDAIVCIGVMEYVNPQIEAIAFAELHRVLRPGGALIVENINELFDLSTFNRFTISFFKRHFISAFVSDDDLISDVSRKVEKLISYPTKPERSGSYRTTRDHVYTKTEIPLIYRDKVSSFGFREVDQVFYRFHAVPPLLFEHDPIYERISIPFEKEYCRHWIANFLASGFISVLVKE